MNQFIILVLLAEYQSFVIKKIYILK